MIQRYSIRGCRILLRETHSRDPTREKVPSTDSRNAILIRHVINTKNVTVAHVRL